MGVALGSGSLVAALASAAGVFATSGIRVLDGPSSDASLKVFYVLSALFFWALFGVFFFQKRATPILCARAHYFVHNPVPFDAYVCNSCFLVGLIYGEPHRVRRALNLSLALTGVAVVLAFLPPEA